MSIVHTREIRAGMLVSVSLCSFDTCKGRDLSGAKHRVGGEVESVQRGQNFRLQLFQNPRFQQGGQVDANELETCAFQLLRLD